MSIDSRFCQHDIVPKHQQIDGTDAHSIEDNHQCEDYDRFEDFAAFLDTFDLSSLWWPDQDQPASLANNNDDAFDVRHRRHKSLTYFVNKGSFSEEEKTLIQRYSHETPAVVMDRLAEFCSTTAHAYGQVKDAVENERRKKNRRADNGPWTVEEIQTISTNMSMTPTALTRLLTDNVHSFRKNVDQVRDMTSMIAQKTKGRARCGKRSKQ